ncbi:hypothetical protein ACFPIK_08275 [Algoriphagus aquatilis]|uniref:Uncharacterized protein n=1 Tax=Algoriphagus aquatilis TaxID=490186 RepID=A0ABW0BVY6_9BACT
MLKFAIYNRFIERIIIGKKYRKFKNTDRPVGALDYLLLDSLPQIEFGAGTERTFGAFQLASFGKVPTARPVIAQNSILGFKIKFVFS